MIEKLLYNIENFNVNEDNFIYFTTNSELFLNYKKNISNKLIGGYIYDKNKIVIINEIDQVFCDLDFSIIKEFKNNDLFFDLKNIVSKNTIFKENGNIICNWYIFNSAILEFEQKLFSGDYGTPLLVIKEKIIILFQIKNEVISFDFFGNISWEFSLNDFQINQNNSDKVIEVSQFSGIYKNKIILTLNTGAVLVLNANNGQILKYWDDLKIRYWLVPSESECNIFWGLSHQTFIEIDCETESLVVNLDLTQQLIIIENIPDESPNYCFITTSVVFKNLIYFISNKNILGVFNPLLKEIIWTHKFNFENKSTILKGGTENLQINDTHIYTLDSEGTLHIIENDFLKV